ncbi:MAG: hypothetical protein QOJ44_1625 [Acidimicrobiaceae bacterium]|jgi:hypothetical protein|nr:hypothetical protein [Acidimicrobiaceae bacterium]
MRRRTYLPLLLVAAPGVMALGIVSPAGAAGSDNGVANQTGTQIVTAAAAATTGAKSFTYGGTTNQGGQSARLTMSVSTSGNGQGTITMGGQPISLKKVGNTVYFRSTKAFWTKNEGQAAAQLIGNRWLSAPVTDADFASIVNLLDAKQVTGQFSVTSGTTFTKGKTGTINGQNVIAVTGKDTSGGGGGTIYVATTGKPYIVKIAASGTSLTFTNYNRPVNPTVPSNSIDIAKLGGTTTTTG